MTRSKTLLVLLCAIVAGCGGGGGGSMATPPSISNLSYSPTNTPQSSGTPVTVSGTVDFTDSGGDLANLIVAILDSTGTQVSSTTTPIQGVAGLKFGTLSGTFQVTASMVGAYTVRVTVTDSGGATSNALSGMFQVVAESGQAAVVTATGASPASLGVTMGGTLYWSEPGEDALKSAPVTGGVATVLATKMVNPVAMLFNGTDVIWLDVRPGATSGPCGTPNPVAILKRTAANGMTSVLASGYVCAPFTGTDIVSDGTNVYWISSTSSTNTYTINSTPLSGGPTTAFATSPALIPIVALQVQAGTIYWMENFDPTTSGAIRSKAASGGAVNTIVSNLDSAVNSFAVDNAYVYYTTPNSPRNLTGNTEMLLAAPITPSPPVVLLASIPTPTKLITAGGQVLWIDATSINSIPVGGGSVTQLATTTNTPLDLLVNGSTVYWSESTGAVHGESGAIKSVPLGGGAARVVYQGGDAPRALALDSQSQLNWTEGGPVGTTEGFARIAHITGTSTVQTVVSGIAADSPPLVANGPDLLVADQWRIKRLPLAGGMPASIAADDGAIAHLTTDGTTVFWDNLLQASVRSAPIIGGSVTILVNQAALGGFSGHGGPIHLAPNGNLYWVADNTQAVMVPPGTASVLSAPAATVSNSVSAVVQGLASISDLAVDGANVYFSEPASGNIMSAPLAGGNAAQLANIGYFPAAAIPLQLDGTNLYWLDANNIAKVPVAGGATTLVLDFNPESDPTTSFAVDAANVYWSEPVLLDIRKSAK